MFAPFERAEVMAGGATEIEVRSEQRKISRDVAAAFLVCTAVFVVADVFAPLHPVS